MRSVVAGLLGVLVMHSCYGFGVRWDILLCLDIADACFSM